MSAGTSLRRREVRVIGADGSSRGTAHSSHQHVTKQHRRNNPAHSQQVRPPTCGTPGMRVSQRAMG